MPLNTGHRVYTAHTRFRFAWLLFEAALLPAVTCLIKNVCTVTLLWFCISHVFISPGLFHSSPLWDSVQKRILFLLWSFLELFGRDIISYYLLELDSKTPSRKSCRTYSLLWDFSVMETCRFRGKRGPGDHVVYLGLFNIWFSNFLIYSQG